MAHADRDQPHALDAQERGQVLGLVTAGRDAGLSVEQVHLRHLDAGPVLASAATFHRLAATTGPPRPRPTRPSPPRSTSTPQLVAVRPDEVYCWDITFLPGWLSRQHYALYSVIDLFSRDIVGHTVQPGEDQQIAARLLAGVIDAAAGTVRKVHSDNGAAMKSHTVAKVLADRGVERSLIRPGVSNDNAYIESWFGTVKYSHAYPGAFEDLDEASQWVTGWVENYNHHHRHTGIGGYTPASVHDGTWTEVARARQQHLDAHYQAHPRRYRRPPKVQTPPQRATINLANDGSRLEIPSTLQALITQ
ncbi:integrase core domain-containing protein [Citricoccus sp. NPDC079358]|uniref:integrase core domain-containing protein n=1 Tax=Citricoccus sp. NPDC079358 TaxID=3154653 RepID=UPI003450302B